MLLPSTPLDAAELQADYVRLAVENLSVGLPVTVSIGVAQWRDDETAAAVCARADAALYRAKHHGRNRVEIDA
jgi:diguanylate cyclase (GGDEF)-like protein